MIEDLELPRFNIPKACQRPSGTLTNEQYLDWIEENVRLLQKQGLYDKLRQNPSRCPVNVRFKLTDE